LARSTWPRVDPRYLEEDRFELVVQVNGKVRGRLSAPVVAGEAELVGLARGCVASWVEGKVLRKTVVVPGRLVNFVVG
jgi:leucyl-tRNA synthetase